MKFSITLIAFLLSAFFSTAQIAPGHSAATDAMITRFIKRWDISGASVAISKNGKAIYSRGFGLEGGPRSQVVTPGNLFRIASVSKPITAIAIMKLVQDGRVSLDDTVFGKNKILDQPYYLNAISDKRIYTITIKNLLEHTAGWDRSVPCDEYDHSDAAFFPLHVTDVLHETNPVHDSSLIKFSVLKGLQYKPGAVFAYSNIGYLVLGKVIEKISGLSYEKFVLQNIFKPLGIYNIHLGKNLLSEKQEHEVEYYSGCTTSSCYGIKKMVPSQYGGFSVEAMNAHGGWIATAEDLCKLLSSLECREHCVSVLKKESVAQMLEPSAADPNYAKGWFVNEKGTSWHTGSMDGTSAFVCRTKDGYTWAFLFNSRADNSQQFWKELDKLPWSCLKTLETVASHNTP